MGHVNLDSSTVVEHWGLAVLRTPYAINLGSATGGYHFGPTPFRLNTLSFKILVSFFASDMPWEVCTRDPVDVCHRSHRRTQDREVKRFKRASGMRVLIGFEKDSRQS